MDTFGERIQNLLKAQNMAQKEFAEKIGCTESAVSRYISGERMPKGNLLVKISVILDTTTDYLLNGTPSDKDSELSYAKVLLRRNVKKMTTKQKMEIVDLLF